MKKNAIMMTTMAALADALLMPSDWLPAPSAATIGLAVAARLVMSQFLTLYMTPVIYLTLDRLTNPSAYKGAVEDGPVIDLSAP